MTWRHTGWQNIAGLSDSPKNFFNSALVFQVSQNPRWWIVASSTSCRTSVSGQSFQAIALINIDNKLTDELNQFYFWWFDWVHISVTSEELGTEEFYGHEAARGNCFVYSKHSHGIKRSPKIWPGQFLHISSVTLHGLYVFCRFSYLCPKRGTSVLWCFMNILSLTFGILISQVPRTSTCQSSYVSTVL